MADGGRRSPQRSRFWLVVATQSDINAGMKAIMVMFDSLNRHLLPPYGGDWVHAPNFRRLAERSVTFDRAYVGSMPCMPARREIHTGRPNFLHRGWGPLEPFDDSMPAMLKKHGVYTHLATDHYHYFEDGGCTYHTKYQTWEFFRGQEGDPWVGQVANWRRCADRTMSDQDQVNRAAMPCEEQQPQPQTFRAGLDFIRRNHTADPWFLQLETFDPHEPFFSPQKYKDLYAEHYRNYAGPPFDWPGYGPATEAREVQEHCRFENAALVSMCDTYLGKVLDLMDELDLWTDTMLIVNTDHGFLLGEHESWAKCWLPWYEELAHMPLFIWDPRCGKRGEHRHSLVQTIDLAPTLLDFFGLAPTPDMVGKPLGATLASDVPVREAGLFGIFGGHVNATDGRYVYMRAATSRANTPLFEYTHMPTHMRGLFGVDELAGKIELAEPFGFTKGCRTMKIPAGPNWGNHPDSYRTMLFDLQTDPQQQRPLNDARIERMMVEHLVREMRACEAPAEQFVRLGLPG